MELDAAQLSALSTSLDQLTDRVTALANELQGAPREDVAADLFDVERHLRAAARKLHALSNRLS